MNKTIAGVIVGAIGAGLGLGISTIQIHKLKKLRNKSERMIKELEANIETTRLMQEAASEALSVAEDEAMKAKKTQVQYEMAKAAYEGAAKALF